MEEQLAFFSRQFLPRMFDKKTFYAILAFTRLTASSWRRFINSASSCLVSGALPAAAILEGKLKILKGLELGGIRKHTAYLRQIFDFSPISVGRWGMLRILRKTVYPLCVPHLTSGVETVVETPPPDLGLCLIHWLHHYRIQQAVLQDKV